MLHVPNSGAALLLRRHSSGLKRTKTAIERRWEPNKEYSDIRFELFEGIAKITIDRPQVRDAFTTVTVAQMSKALAICRQRNDVRVVVLTGAGEGGHPGARRRLHDAPDRPAIRAAAACLKVKAPRASPVRRRTRPPSA